MTDINDINDINATSDISVTTDSLESNMSQWNYDINATNVTTATNCTINATLNRVADVFELPTL